MKSLLLGGVTALILTVSASAQNANDANPATTNPPAAATTNAPAAAKITASAGAGEFITAQQVGEVRAPKLVGVAVYDKDNKSVGKVADLLLDKQGKIQAVVIGIGGFLGIGTKDIALPYDAVHWQTEQRTVATNTAPAAAPGAASDTTNSAGGATTANNTTMQKTVTPEQQEAYNGYPDRAVVDMSQQQLKDAPDFKYASQTANSAAEVNAKKP